MNQTNWNRSSWFVALMAIGGAALLLSGRLLSPVHAAPEAVDSDAKPLPPSVIAVIDVGKIFAASTAQKTKMKEIEAGIDEFDLAIKAAKAELQSAEEKRKLLPAGSDEAAQAELQNKQQALTLQTRVAQKQAELMKREGEVYFDTYAEMERVLKIEARKRGVTMVFRHGKESMNRSDRETVFKGVNRAIVFTQEQYDLTEVVIQGMNK